MAAEPDYSIHSGFQGQIARPKTSVFYHAGLVLVAGTMLLLPLIYVAMVGLVAYAVYFHAVYDWRPIMGYGTYGSGLLFKLIFYFAPLLTGVVVVFFMFKPLLAGRPKRAQPLALNPANERLLYAFIEKICDVVGAPSPKRIDLDCQINAAAHFRHGFFSLFSNDLVLVLGLPLVANLTARELAGVIAHEFGHFTQGAGMRLSYIINSVNFWFARVAYQRDSWDVALESWAAEVNDARLAIIVWSIQLSVWFSRLILKLLMLVGHIVGGFMLRQMEYDADAYEIKVAGSECFETTTRKLATLGAAWDETQKQLIASWRKSKTLPDNLPALIQSSHRRLPAAVMQKINDTLGLHRAGVFDSHPSPADRIRQARKASDAGIFHDERPASSLFASFEHPSRFVTLLHYTDDIGIPITESMLTRVEMESSAASAGIDLSHAYFLGILPLMKPLRLGAPVASAKLDADYAELNQIASGVQQIAPQLVGFAQQDDELLDQRTSAGAAHCLLNNGFALPAGTFSLPRMNLGEAAAAEEDAIAARKELRHSLREVMPMLNRRLELAISLALANVGEAAAQDGGQSITKLVGLINDSAERYLQQVELAEAFLFLQKINDVRASDGDNPAMRRALAAQEQRVRSLSERLNPSPEPVAGGPRLQISKSSSDLTAIQRKNHEWLAGYDRMLAELVRLVAHTESFTPA
jgi:Zn-dependent protease with chaperone function